MKSIKFILLAIILHSCVSNSENSLKHKGKVTNETQDVIPQVNDQFTGYLKNFKKSKLPFTIKGCRLDFKTLKVLDLKKFNKFSKSGIDNDLYSYLQFPTNGKYLATISLSGADCFLPVLTTYKLNGQIIDEKMLAIGYCGSDCGYNCEEFMRVKNDFSIYVSDTISTYECDSLGEEITGTFQHYIIYKKGEILKNGKIKLSGEIRKNIK